MPTGIYIRKPGLYRRKPRTSEQIAESARRRILALSHPVTECGCWLFMGAINRLGYGEFAISKTVHTVAHRASYRFFVADIPDGMHVLHRCDVRCCVNPDHLFLGTHADNMRDMSSKGRTGVRLGEQHHMTSLTEEDVRFIRASPESHASLSRRFGVSRTSIADIRRGRVWRHVYPIAPPMADDARSPAAPQTAGKLEHV